jgi:hypothetical protein
MPTLTRPRRRWFLLAGPLLLGLWAVGGTTERACPQAPAAGNGYDVTRRRLELIAPGTVLDRDAPKGWSHLIIKSHPRVAAGDVDQVSDHTVRLSSFLFTAIVARVQPDRGTGRPPYHLSGLAVGLGTKVNGKDIILSPETQKRLGANLGLLARLVLSTAQERLHDVHVVARSDTLALVDAPALMLRDGRHRPVMLRYALLVEAATGNLETLLWLIDLDAKGGYLGASGPIEWLPPNKHEDCVLHVDAKEFVLGTPTEKAFAMYRMPRGRKQLALPDDLKAAAGQAQLSAALAQELEAKLREALAQSAAR